MTSRGLFVVTMMLAAAVPAGAEVVFFTTGRTMSVRSARVDGDRVVLVLRSGGEVVCERAIVARIEPDEIPYPDEAAPALLPTILAGAGSSGATATRFDALIQSVAVAHGVDVDLVHAVISVESGYQPRARSPKGAMGLMQLMPSTARQYALHDPYDPLGNIEAGTRHLKSLLDRFPLSVALAAYNAGEAAVLRFGGVPPFPETQSYVARVLGRIRR